MVCHMNHFSVLVRHRSCIGSYGSYELLQMCFSINCLYIYTGLTFHCIITSIQFNLLHSSLLPVRHQTRGCSSAQLLLSLRIISISKLRPPWYRRGAYETHLRTPFPPNRNLSSESLSMKILHMLLIIRNTIK